MNIIKESPDKKYILVENSEFKEGLDDDIIMHLQNFYGLVLTKEGGLVMCGCGGSQYVCRPCTIKLGLITN